ncbi:hypothetical protein [Streptomyces sp. NPDC002573]|uniref:hypothetical protein n=1 Tax=Streptomyces sp. NPDC002573 TaxID=3364651 RepID=UPI0036A5D25E
MPKRFENRHPRYQQSDQRIGNVRTDARDGAVTTMASEEERFTMADSRQETASAEPPEAHRQLARDSVRLAVVIGALGVVFGDIGTSPVQTHESVGRQGPHYGHQSAQGRPCYC